MSYIRGQLPYVKVPQFLEYLNRNGFTCAAGSGVFEVGQVLLNGKFKAITTTGKKVIGYPDELHEHVLQFLREANDTPHSEGAPDSKRLDFMLSGSRQVVVELLGYGASQRPYQIYVEEGVMGQKRYPAVHWQQPNEVEYDQHSKEVLALKRQAIDLAIANQ